MSNNKQGPGRGSWLVGHLPVRSDALVGQHFDSRSVLPMEDEGTRRPSLLRHVSPRPLIFKQLLPLLNVSILKTILHLLKTRTGSIWKNKICNSTSNCYEHYTYVSYAYSIGRSMDSFTQYNRVTCHPKNKVAELAANSIIGLDLAKGPDMTCQGYIDNTGKYVFKVI